MPPAELGLSVRWQHAGMNVSVREFSRHPTGGIAVVDVGLYEVGHRATGTAAH